ncbi:ANTAR domain-containing protein [Streptomyces bottropensis]|uniref:ANTAR domain-containing protein n=2 Tax=Streptomyces bottropensis TaxID=42235 RepID=UPI003686490C
MRATAHREGCRQSGFVGKSGGVVGAFGRALRPGGAASRRNGSVISMGVPHNSRPESAEVRHPQGPDDSTAKIIDLQRHNDHLQTAITSHAVIDQAIGVVIALGALRPQQGFDVLKDVSQHTNVKLREIAGLIVDWVLTHHLPDDVQEALDAALQKAQSAPSHGIAPDPHAAGGSERTTDDGEHRPGPPPRG